MIAAACKTQWLHFRGIVHTVPAQKGTTNVFHHPLDQSKLYIGALWPLDRVACGGVDCRRRGLLPKTVDFAYGYPSDKLVKGGKEVFEFQTICYCDRGPKIIWSEDDATREDDPG